MSSTSPDMGSWWREAMRPVHCVILGLAFSTGGWRASAQLPDAPRPAFDGSLIADSRSSTHDAIDANVSSSQPVTVSSEGVALVESAPVPARRVASFNFYAWNGLHLGMAVFDVEMTQRCIAAHHCRETNPLLPSSRMGQLTVNLSIVAYTTVLSYWLKKHQSGIWWLPPAAGGAGHCVGVATGFEHQ